MEGELFPPPPQPMSERDREASRNPQLSMRRDWRQRLILRGANESPNTPAMASPVGGSQGGTDGPKGRSERSAAVAAAVVTVNVLLTGEPPDGLTLAGEKEHAARLGSVPQANFTVPA